MDSGITDLPVIARAHRLRLQLLDGGGGFREGEAARSFIAASFLEMHSLTFFLRDDLIHEIRRDFLDETARHVRIDLAVHGTHVCIGHIELFLRARDRHVAEASLFFKSRRLHEGTDTRKNTFIHARQEDEREFQPLRTMDGHQGDAVVFPFIGVDIVYESDFFKEFRESAFRLLGDEVFRDRKQLAQIFLTALRLRILALLQLCEILRICHDLLDQFENIHFRGRIQKIKDHRREIRKLALRSRRKPTALDAHDALEHRHAAGIRIVQELLDRRPSDTALWCIDDAGQTDIILEIIDDLQISQHVADFRAVIEACPADHRIADAASDERFFDDTRLRIHAVEDCHIAIGAMLFHMLFLHRFDDETCFRMLIDRGVMLEMRTGIILCPQTLRRAIRIVLYHCICRVQDRLRRAVVLLELDELRLRIVLLEIHDIP